MTIKGTHDLADKMKRLISAVGDPSTERLAEAIMELTDTRISGAYIWQLKKGKRSNLTLLHLTAFSAYFSKAIGIPITLSYFDPATPVEEPWEVRNDENHVAELQSQLEEEQRFNRAMDDRGIRHIATRYGSMDPAQQRQLLAIADVIAGSTGGGDNNDEGE